MREIFKLRYLTENLTYQGDFDTNNVVKAGACTLNK